MRKRILSLLLCLMMLISLLPSPMAMAEPAAQEEAAATDMDIPGGGSGSEDDADDETPASGVVQGSEDPLQGFVPGEDEGPEAPAPENPDVPEQPEVPAAVDEQSLADALAEEEDDGVARVTLTDNGVMFYGTAPEGTELKVSGRPWFSERAVKAANAEAFEAEQDFFTLTAKATVALEGAQAEGKVKLFFTGIELGEKDSIEILMDLGEAPAPAEGEEAAPAEGEGDPTVELRGGKLVKVFSVANGNLKITKQGWATLYVDALPASFTLNVTFAVKPVEKEEDSKQITVDRGPSKAPAAKAPAAKAPAEEQGNRGETDSFTIEIRYFFEDHTPAAGTYSNSFTELDFPINPSVPFPAVLGYQPTVSASYAGMTVDANAIHFSYNKLEDVPAASISFEVTYVPAPVDVTYIIWIQNPNDDDYTEAHRVTAQAATESQVPEYDPAAYGYPSAAERPCLTQLRHETPVVAADGSTVVNVYFDRKYYTLNFDLGEGGYGVEPIYDRYGADIPTPAAPTRPGYSFTGWTNLPSTMPGNNTTVVTANWNPLPSTFTVAYWYQNPDDNGYTLAGTYSTTANTGTSKRGSDYRNQSFTGKDVYQDLHFTYKQDDGSKPVKADGSTVLNVYFDRKIFKIVFLVCKENHTPHNGADGGCYRGANPNYNTYGPYSFRYGQNISSWWVNTVPSETGCPGGSRWWPQWYTVKEDGSSILYGSNGAQCNLLTMPYVDCADPNRPSAFGRDTLVFGFDQNTSTRMRVHEFYAETLNPSEAVFEEDPNNPHVYYSVTHNTGAYRYYKRIDTQKVTYWSDGNDASEFIPRPGYTADWTIMYYWTRDDENDPGLIFALEGGPGTLNTVLTTGELQTHYNRVEHSTARFFYRLNNTFVRYFSNNQEVFTDQVPYGQQVGKAEHLQNDATAPRTGIYSDSAAWVFDGWYTAPDGGTKVTKTTTTAVPADGVSLYAHWTPVKHSVQFYRDSSLTQAVGAQQNNIAHHGTATPPASVEAEEGFLGWFYKEGTIEKAYSASTPIILGSQTSPLKIYAKWDQGLSECVIHYYLENTTTKVADDSTESGRVGYSRTFTAKADQELHAAYQDGCFPLRASSNANFVSGGTEYIFYYRQGLTVPYTVEYRYGDSANDGGLIPVSSLPSGTSNPASKGPTSKSAVVERAPIVEGYMPDKAQKRLVLAAEGENKLIFWYKADPDHAYVTQEYHIWNLSSNDYVVDDSLTESTRVSIPGTYNEKRLTATAGLVWRRTEVWVGNSLVQTVTNEGTTASRYVDSTSGATFKIFYDLTEVGYTVQYLVQSTGTPLFPSEGPSELGAVRYRESKTFTAKTKDGYRVVGSASITHTMKANAAANVITFYYAVKDYTITYNPSGGSVSPTSQTYNIESTDVVLAKPQREGYSFTIWQPETSVGNWNSSSTYPDGMSVNGHYGDVTLVARWIPNVYTITLNDQGATTAGTAAYYEKYATGNYANAACTSTISTITVPQKTGYSFGGYYAQPNGAGTQYVTADGSITSGYKTFTEDTTLYAKWTADTYTITYTLNDGALPSGTSNPTTYTVETPNFTLNNPQKTGYTFLGWSGTDISGVSLSVMIPQGSTGDRAYTAQWQINSYTVTGVWEEGDPSETGGAISGSPQTVEYQAAHDVVSFQTAVGYYVYQLKTNETWGAVNSMPGAAVGYPIRQTYGVYSPGGGVTQDITYTARTRPITFDIIYDENGGSDVADQTYDITQAVTLVAAPTRNGYTFAGWKIDSTASKQNNWYTQTGNRNQYNSAEALGTGLYGRVVLKAQWTTNNYTITYDLDDGALPSGTSNPTSYTVETATITLTNPTKAGYTFTGWSGTDLTGEDNMTVTIPQGSTGDRAYTAHWSANTDTAYTVKHILVSASGAETLKETEPKTGTTGQPTAAAAKSYDGYTARAVTQKTIQGDGSTVVEIRYDENMVTIQYQIVGLTDGGTLNKTSETVAVVTGTPSATVTLAEGNFKLLGWYNNEACSGSALSTELTYAPEKVDGKHVEAIYYAKIVPAKITVTGRIADDSHGQITGLPQTIDYGAMLPNDIVFISDYGYMNDYVTASAELEWPYTVTNTTWASFTGGGQHYYQDTELVLHTRLIQYTITYDPNGGELPDGAEQTLSYNIESTDTLLAPKERSGYVFTGWKVTETGSSPVYSNWVLNTTYTAGTAVTGKYGDVTLQAQWTAKTNATYTVHYYLQDSDPLEKLHADKIETGKTYDHMDDESAISLDGYTAVNTTETPSSGQVRAGYNTDDPKDNEISFYYTADTFTLTYDAAGGALPSGTSATQSYTIRDTLVIASATRDGYTFAGWKPKENVGNWATSESFSAGASVDGRWGDVTLEAQWTTVDYTVTYEPGDGGTNVTGMPDPNPKGYNVEESFSLGDAPVWSGYRFLNWKVKEDAGSWDEGTTFVAKASIGSGRYGNVVLVAQWERIDFNVTYKANGGEGADKVDTRTVEQAYAVKDLGTGEDAVNFSYAGRSFTGWNTQADGQGTDYAVGDDLTTLTEDLTLYAQWERIATTVSVKVQVAGNGGDTTKLFTGTPYVTLYAGGAYGTVTEAIADQEVPLAAGGYSLRHTDAAVSYANILAGKSVCIKDILLPEHYDLTITVGSTEYTFTKSGETGVSDAIMIPDDGSALEIVLTYTRNEQPDTGISSGADAQMLGLMLFVFGLSGLTILALPKLRRRREDEA